MSRRMAVLICALVAGPASILAAAGTAVAGTGPGSGVFPGTAMVRVPGVADRGGRGPVESLNWSGYVLAGGTGRFRAVSASWTVPAVTCQPGPDQYSASWVGLDGYTSPTVEQGGTEADCLGGQPYYAAWYEMYPAAPVRLSAPVRPGDRIRASVSLVATMVGPPVFAIVLQDVTAGWTRVATAAASGRARSSAEVITEAPSAGGAIVPLANFGTVRYSNCVVNGRSLGAGRPIRLVMVNGNGQLLAGTSAISKGGAFSNTWRRSG